MGRGSVAGRRYMRRFAPAMASYVVLILGVSFWLKHAPPAAPLLYLAAILPALPLLVVIWAIGRYLVEEADEYQRALHVQSVLWGAGVTLALATVWGFLEMYARAPHVPAYWGFTLFCAAWGLAQCSRQLADHLAARR